MSRAGLLAQLGEGPIVEPVPLLDAMGHRGGLRRELVAPGVRAWVVSHDDEGDGWDVHVPATSYGWTVVVHGRLRGPAPASAEGIAALLEDVGPGGLARLLGPFAVVATHPSTGTTVLARSTEGNRPLFITAAADGLVVASEPAALLRLPGIERAIDEWAAATTLCGYMELGRSTLWRAVRRVEAGTAEVHRGGLVEEVSLWPTLPVLPFKGDGDALATAYADALRDVVAGSVPSRGGVACDVSGGLDSSSVAIVLADVLPEADTRLTTVTLVFDDVPAADERAYAEAVLDLLPGRRVVERPGPPPPASLVAESRTTADPPSAANREPPALLARLVADGVTHLFTGQGGDDLFDAGATIMVDHLRSGHVGRALATAREVAAWGGQSSRRAAARMLWGYGARPLLRPLVRRVGVGRRARPLSHLSPDWVRRTGWHPADPMDEARAGSLGSSASLLDALRSPYRTLTDEGCERDAALAGLEEVDPYCDIQMVELALSVPLDLRLRDGDPRWLQRTLPGLPSAVAERRTKAEFSVQFVEAVAAYLDDPEALVAIGRAGWLAEADPLALRDQVREMPRADQAWYVVAMDAWLRAQALPTSP